VQSTTGAGNRSTPVFVPAQEVQIMSMEEEEEFAPDVSTYSCEFLTNLCNLYVSSLLKHVKYLFSLLIYLFIYLLCFPVCRCESIETVGRVQ
jgi:hypothetical protein